MITSRCLLGTVLAALALVVLFIAASGASAQQAKRARAPKIIELEEIKIEGRVQKPNAFYILTRSTLGYEVM
jgi:hypothetical protein